MPSTADHRQAPQVPNHEMVRSIGRGSYGEIWLARSLTGTWRAVKIVDRRTFESDKAFQREFEGMAKFEPISREDAGFVDILHVGRDEHDHFFYYVMELADDHIGRAVDPVTYVPKTIKTELSRRSRLLADECITIGLSLTKALGALHRQGLVHRDIKPANIIFVGGVPKIADIGLVAATGQDSYVGTEGYVPPEGPGSVQADIYSLGKVLYELAMGKDRMDFPAVNTQIADLPDKVALLRLNEVLLRACDANCRQRYASAEEMHDDLVRLRDGQPLDVQVRRRKPIFASIGVLVLLGCAGFYAAKQHHSYGGVRIETDPPAAAMVTLNGKVDQGPVDMWPSPAQFDRLPVGKYSAHIMLAGYEPTELAFEVKADEQTHPKPLHLKRAYGALQINCTSAGATFELRDKDKVVKSGTTPATLNEVPVGHYQLVWLRDLRSHIEPIEIEHNETLTKDCEFAMGVIDVTSDPPGAMISLDGEVVGPAALTGTPPLELKVAEGQHDVSAQYRGWPVQHKVVDADHGASVEADFEFPFGSVKITSAPAGASVWQKGKELGRTPLPIEDLEPGEVHYELRLPGYQNIEVNAKVNPGEQTFLNPRFVKRLGPRRGEPWENSLGMKFVPVGDVLMDVWPTRVRDYDAFCANTGRARPIPRLPPGRHPSRGQSQLGRRQRLLRVALQKGTRCRAPRARPELSPAHRSRVERRRRPSR